MLIKQNPDLRQRILPVLSRKISKTNTEAETDKNFEDTNRPTYLQPLPQSKPGQVAGEGEDSLGRRAEGHEDQEKESEKSSTLFIKIIKKYFHVL